MLKQCFRSSLLIAAAALLMAAAPDEPQLELKREPIVVTSSHMKADKLGERVVFSGEVTLKKEAMTLNSDSVTVFYDAGTRAIREIEALGNVIVRKEGRIALASRALYYSKEEKIVLTGDARIIENDNQLGGERITLFIRDDRSIVEGGNVLFYQDKQDKKPEKRRGR
jgi:lipopolysaccharide export system protein LptA